MVSRAIWSFARRLVSVSVWKTYAFGSDSPRDLTQDRRYPFPTPVVFTAAQGHTCIGAAMETQLHDGFVEVDVTGFLN